MELHDQNRTYHEAQDAMSHLPNYFRWTYGKFTPWIKGTVVELGCGAGHGVRYYIDQIEHLYAVDCNSRLLESLRDTYAGNKVTVINADLGNDWSALDTIRADTVIMMDVIEHFKDDEQLLARAAQLLKDNGRIVIKAPAQSNLYGEMDIASGHYRRYDRPDFRRLADKTGLQIKKIARLNPLGALAYGRRKKQNSNFSKSFSLWQLKGINAAMPLIQLLDAAPFLPGLSEICIMEKTAAAPTR